MLEVDSPDPGQFDQDDAINHRGLLADERSAYAKTNMARTDGWWDVGCRSGLRSAGHWRSMTFLAAIRHDQPCVIDGPINGESFRAYVKQVLVPTLQPGDIVVMDNLGSQKEISIRRLSAPSMRGSSS